MKAFSCSAVVVLLAGLGAGTTAAQVVSLVDYLPLTGEQPRCVAPLPDNHGTYSRTVRFICYTGREHIALTKGDPDPWGQEVFYESGGWLRAIEESAFCTWVGDVIQGLGAVPVAPNLCGSGSCPECHVCTSDDIIYHPQQGYRVFRDDGDHLKGWRVAPMGPTQVGVARSIPPYHEEYWKDGGNPPLPNCWALAHGAPPCGPTPGVTQGSAYRGWLTKVTLPEWLANRTAMSWPVKRVDVDAVETHWLWGNPAGEHTEEVHVWGRYRDPNTGAWVRLGHVDFWAVVYDANGNVIPRHPGNVQRSSIMYLVDCAMALRCSACADEW